MKANATSRRPSLLLAAVFLGGLLLYVSTLAPSVVFGDPAEYTFVPYAWGVIHPPGYALQTVLARLWQTVVPLGTVAWRTNLLSAVAAAATAALTYSSVRLLGGGGRIAAWGGLLAAVALAVSPDFWQHALHANAHIITVTLAALALFCLLRWQAAQNDRWLKGFAFVAGLSAAHHPLLAFSFPAYLAFILVGLPVAGRAASHGLAPSNMPMREALAAVHLKRLLAALPWAVLGLAPWLYFPIRSVIQPPPVIGPHDMNTVEGFLNLVLARGLTVNLFHFGLGQQWQRLIVFWSLLRLQMPLPILALMPVGAWRLWRRDWRAGLLLSLFLGVNLAFILNTVQDVMAYFMVPLAALAVLAGLGAQAVLEWGAAREAGGVRWGARGSGRNADYQSPIATLLLAALFVWPLVTLLHNYPRVSLRGYTAADDYVDESFARFAGMGEGAVLLSDWEHLTPLWYRQHVVGQALEPADVTPVFVSGGERPWVDAVWANIEAGPIYVVEYQPQIVAEGFRLRASGSLYQVVAPPATEVPPIASPLPGVTAGPVEILGYDLGEQSAQAGDVIPLTLYLRAAEPVADILFPQAALGPYTMQWTTDSHLLTPQWLPGEVIAERFDLTVPLDAPGGEYAVRLGMANLTTGEEIPITNPQLPEGENTLELTTIAVTANPAAPPARVLDGLAANFGQRVGVEAVTAWAGGRRAVAPWPEPLVVRPGDAVQLFVRWRALAPSENSATVFVHLLDAGNSLWAGQDYTPLGGAFPTTLWFPKWLEGQRALDPYTVTVPPDAPPGDYYLEVGLYGLRTIQRVPAFDRAGNLAGDRFVLGGVKVED